LELAKFETLLVFGVAFQIVAYLFWAFDVCPFIEYPISVDSIQNSFTITPFSLMFAGAGAAAIGLAAMLLRAGTYAVYAMLLWAIGTILPVVSNFFLAIPNTLGALMPFLFSANAPSNPFPGETNPLFAVIIVIFTFSAYWFLFRLVTQRN